MATHEPVVLVTIVAEAVLEHRLVRDLQAAGCRGWTIVEARGVGSRGRRVGDVEGGNLRVETVVPAGVADRLMDLLGEAYFPHYAAVAWTCPVQVVRGEKYA